MKLSESLSWIGQVLHKSVAEHSVKRIVVKRERIAVSGLELALVFDSRLR
jgi:hypothetical protein